MREFELIDRNLRTALQFFGAATEQGENKSGTQVDTIYCGLNYGVFNIGLLSNPTPSLLAPLVACQRYFQSYAQRWSFWLCEDWLESSARKHIGEISSAMGLRSISRPPGMIAEDIRPASRELPSVETIPVTEQRMRDAFAYITGSCFDIPPAICNAVYGQERAWQGAYRGYVGMVNGAPVTIAAVCHTPGALGIYSVATMPAFRRKGYSESLLRSIVVKERKDREPLVLQSSESGHRIYKRLGFRDVSSYTVFLTK